MSPLLQFLACSLRWSIINGNWSVIKIVCSHYFSQDATATDLGALINLALVFSYTNHPSSLSPNLTTAHEILSGFKKYLPRIGPGDGNATEENKKELLDLLEQRSSGIALEQSDSWRCGCFIIRGFQAKSREPFLLDGTRISAPPGVDSLKMEWCVASSQAQDYQPFCSVGTSEILKYPHKMVSMVTMVIHKPLM